MDVHVPWAITAQLRRRGIVVLTADDDGALEFDDDTLLQRVTALERVLLTSDQDFLRIAAEWQATGRRFRAIVFAHQLGPGIGRIIADMDLMLHAAEDHELWGRLIHLPLT